MAKRPNKSEVVEYLWGIHDRTFEVCRIEVTRGGMMTLWTARGPSDPHPIHPSGTAADEARIAFDLSDVHSIPSFVRGTESETKLIAELGEKAKEKKAAAG